MTVVAEFTDDAPEEPNLLEHLRLMVQREGVGSDRAQVLFHQFYRAWYATVDRWSRAKVPWVCVDEVIQETFWRVWQWTRGSRALLAPPAMLWHCWQWAVADVLRTWFGRRSAGTVQSPAARDLSRPGMSSIDYPDEVTHAWLATIADAADVEVVVLQREARRTLQAALDDLPARDRACVACRYLQSLSVQETATRLGLTIDQVKKHTSRGLRGLALIFLTGSSPR